MSSVQHLDRSTLEILFGAYVHCRDQDAALNVGDQLASELQKANDLDGAAGVLGAVAQLSPDDINLLLKIGTLLEKSGDKARAAEYFENAASQLENKRKYREALKVLKLLQSLDPKSVDVRQRIAATQALLDKFERRKKRRMTVAGIVLVLGAGLLVVPILYNAKAYELLEHGRRLEQIAMVSFDFTKAREAYSRLQRDFGFSTSVAAAQEGLDRLESAERTHYESMSRPDTSIVAVEKLQARRNDLRAVLAKVIESEKSGDFKEAHKLLNGVFKEFRDLPEVGSLAYPLLITTYPSGASIQLTPVRDAQADQTRSDVDSGAESAGKHTGTTPLVYHYRPGDQVELKISLKGCTGVEKTLSLDSQPELHFELKRVPTKEFSPVIGTEQDFSFAHGRLVAPSRDGRIYGIDPKRGRTIWKRSIGRFADRPSNVATRRDEAYVGTTNGEVTAISVLNGKSRWITKVGGPIYAAPAISSDGTRVVVTTLHGEIAVIDNTQGTVLHRFETENENRTSALLLGERVVVGSTDNSLYVDTLTGDRHGSVDLGADIVTAPVAIGESALACTADGRIHAIRLSNPPRRLWSSALGGHASTKVLTTGQSAIVATHQGRVVTIDLKTGEIKNNRRIGGDAITALRQINTTLYACTTRGSLIAIDVHSNATRWRYETGIPITAAATPHGGQLYVGTSIGKFFVFEIME